MSRDELSLEEKVVMKPIKVMQIALTVLMAFMTVLLLIEHQSYGYAMAALTLIGFMSIFARYPSRGGR
jgi:hypothetical protein